MCLNHQLAQAFDSTRSDAFAERLISTLNEGAVCLMLSVGHRTGLFDALGKLPPSSSQGVADAAGLDERYVREWLGAMVTGGIVDYDPATKAYSLPPEHAAFLTRDASPNNISVFAQYIAVLGQVEDDIVDCFRSGGGVPYQRYRRFHEVMAEDSGQTVLASLEDHIIPLAPGLREKLERGIQVLDVGCGRGHAIIQLAQRYPASHFLGIDLSPEAIQFARREAARLRLANADFQVRDVTDFDSSAEPNRYDLVTTFDAVHDQADPLAALKGIHRTLKAGGIYLMQDIHGSSHLHNNMDHPVAPLLYTVSTMHCMTVSLAQGGAGLGTLWGREKAEELLRETGFASIDVHQLEHDFQNDYYVMRKVSEDIRRRCGHQQEDRRTCGRPRQYGQADRRGGGTGAGGRRRTGPARRRRRGKFCRRYPRPKPPVDGYCPGGSNHFFRIFRKNAKRPGCPTVARLGNAVPRRSAHALRCA